MIDSDSNLRVALGVDGSADVTAVVSDIRARLGTTADVVLGAESDDANLLLLVGASTGTWDDAVVEQCARFVDRHGPDRVAIVVDGAPRTATIAEIAGDDLAALFPVEPLWLDARAGMRAGLQTIVSAIERERQRRQAAPSGTLTEPSAPVDIGDSDPVPPARALPSETSGQPAPAPPPSMPTPTDVTQVQCRNCGEWNAASRTFCQRCAAALVVQSPAMSTPRDDWAPRSRVSGGCLRSPLLVGLLLIGGLVLAALVFVDTAPSASGSAGGTLLVMVVVAAIAAAFFVGRRSGRSTVPVEAELVPPPAVPPPPVPPSAVALADFAPQAHDRKLAFVSYASDDEAGLVRELVDWIKAVVDVWFAAAEVRAGHEWVFELSDALERADYFVIVMTPSSMASGWVRQELGVAFRRNVETGSPRLVPVLAEQCEYPILLGNFQMIDATRLDADQTRRRVVGVLA